MELQHRAQIQMRVLPLTVPYSIMRRYTLLVTLLVTLCLTNACSAA